MVDLNYNCQTFLNGVRILTLHPGAINERLEAAYREQLRFAWVDPIRDDPQLATEVGDLHYSITRPHGKITGPAFTSMTEAEAIKTAEKIVRLASRLDSVSTSHGHAYERVVGRMRAVLRSVLRF
jgi:hypothetical protein